MADKGQYTHINSPERTSYPRCEFFFDHGEKGYYLEEIAGYFECLNVYGLPQEKIERLVDKINSALRNSPLQKAVPPETVIDKKPLYLLSVATVFISLFVIFAMIEVYSDQPEAMFFVGIILLSIGLFLILVIIVCDGDFRFKRKSDPYLSDGSARIIRSIVEDVVSRRKDWLAKHGAQIRLSVRANKLRLISINELE